MISKQQQKLIRSLEHKKYRDQLSLFIGEGPKVVGELLKSFRCKVIVATSEWLTQNSIRIAENVELHEVTPQELERISLLKTPQSVIGIFEKKNISCPPIDIAATNLCIALDHIQDPGNLGTIIRTANWFGIDHIICSLDTADPYSPKVIQATMGAIARSNLYSTDLAQYFASAASVPIYGTFLQGENIYETPLTNNGIILMGNEGKGISESLAAHVTNRLFIPPFRPEATTVESLNVAIATAVTCAEFRRRT